MKISLVIISIIFAISLTFTIVGLVSFDLSVDQIKDLLGSRNEGFAVNMIQGLDKHTENRLTGFKELTKLNLIHAVLLESNEKFAKIQDIDSYLNVKEREIEFTENNPFFGSNVEETLTEELVSIIEFYHDEYNYDVIEEMFVTNAYGANVVLASGSSDYVQSDEQWWQKTKETGKHIGKIRHNETYDNYSMAFAFRVDDVDGNFIGVLRAVINLENILSSFTEEAGIVTIQGREVILIDGNGNTIYLNEGISISDSALPYFQKIQQGNNIGTFELEDKTDDFLLISYAKSTGYRSFEGFDWIIVVEQNSSSILQELVVLRNSILGVSITGMIAAIIGGVIISNVISSPMKRVTEIANTISKGNFDVRINKSRIDEVNTISNALYDMSNDLKRLIDTEKKLVEANVKIKRERLTAIGELAASMAHDMKNPLTTIKSSAQILQKDVKIEGELHEVIKRMNRAIDRMSHQIDDVLNYVRTTPLDVGAVNVSQLLQSAKNSLNMPDNISCNIPDSDIQVKGDARKLETVFVNLLLNSIQAIGENQGKIECTVDKQDSDAKVQIQDSGPGIPEDVFEQIFEPLVTSKQKGTGLGLSTCKNIVQQHRGTIKAQNNPTRFTIILPMDFE